MVILPTNKTEFRPTAAKTPALVDRRGQEVTSLRQATEQLPAKRATIFKFELSISKAFRIYSVPSASLNVSCTEPSGGSKP